MIPKKTKSIFLITLGILALFFGVLSLFVKKPIQEKIISLNKNAAPLENKVVLPAHEAVIKPFMPHQNGSQEKKIVIPSHRNPSQTILQPEALVATALLSGTRWKVWAGTTALTTDEGQTVLGRIGRFFIVENKDLSSRFEQFDSKNPIVVYNERLKKPGIVTGVIKLETNQRARLEIDLKSLHATITDAFDPIQTYFIISTDPIFDLNSLFQSLKSISYIKNIELEILDKNYEKN